MTKAGVDPLPASIRRSGFSEAATAWSRITPQCSSELVKITWKHIHVQNNEVRPRGADFRRWKSRSVGEGLLLRNEIARLVLATFRYLVEGVSRGD